MSYSDEVTYSQSKKEVLRANAFYSCVRSYPCFCPVEPEGNATCKAKGYYSQWADITPSGITLLSMKFYYSQWTPLTLTEVLLHSIAVFFFNSRNLR